MKKYLFFILTLSFVLIASSASVSAQNNDLFTAEVDTNYSVDSSDQLKVTHKVVVNNQADLAEVERMTISTVNSDVTGLEGSYQDGIDMDLKTEQNSLSFEVASAFRVGKQQWSFTVSYQVSDIYERTAPIESLYLPPVGLSSTTIDRNFITLSLPEKVDTPYFFGQQPDSAVLALDSKIYKFEFNGDQAHQSGLIAAFSDQLSFEFKNSSALVLPGDTANQRTFLESAAAAISLDEDFNIINNEGAGSGYLTLKLTNTDLTKASPSLDPMAVQGLSAMTDQGGQWPQFTEITPEDNSGTNLETLQSLMLQAPQNPTINFKESLASNGSFVRAARVAGIPARLILGDNYQMLNEASGQPTDYAWAEVYLGNTGWVQVDYHQGQKFNSFGDTNPFLIAKYVWGSDSEQPDLSNLLKSESYESSILNIFEGVDSSDVYTAKLQRNAIIPFIVYYDNLSLSAPKGYVTDQNAVRLGDNMVDFGTLGPLSKVSKKSFRLGSVDSVDYGINSAEGFNRLYPGSVSVSYGYFAAGLIILIAASVTGVQFSKKRRSGREIAPTGSFEHPLFKKKN